MIPSLSAALSSEDAPGFVYCIGEAGRQVKVGYSNNPKRRLDNIRVASPIEVQMIALVPGSIDDERDMHDKISHLRIRGEWFDDSGFAVSNLFPKIEDERSHCDVLSLRDYLSVNAIRQGCFARLVGVRQPTVSRLVSGKTRPSLDLALRIETETKGKVPASVWAEVAQDLRDVPEPRRVVANETGAN